MARRAGPSARSRRLAHALRRLRIDGGFSSIEVAKAVGMSGSKICRLEAAELGIYQDDLEKLLDFYRVPKKRRVELLDIARNAEQRSWLRTRNPHFPGDWQTWSDFEDEASTLLHYDPLTIPGLLQTREYAREIIRATGPDLADEQVDALVASRMARQSLLGKVEPVRLAVVLEEGVLTRPFGEDGAAGRQIRALIDAAEQSTITIQILSPQVGLHLGLTGPFIVLEYDDEPSLVWLENSLTSLFLEDDDQVDAYVAAWGELAKLARTPEESLAFMSKMADR
ncbi:helix-turn-helix domain-containing protein [Saccharopolyspora shandongensis]|uniref:helix-turn-helix domain-containing protein n=1 Tax=Saccharopolyspora shandongensis TaxID=418495 RepID=UPI0033C3A725